VKPFWILGIDRTVQNMVGAADYGLYFAVFNFTFLFNIFLDFGITNFNNKNIAQNNHLLNKHFSAILVLKFIMALAYFILVMLFAWIVGYDHQQFYLLIFLAINQFLISLVLYLRSNVSGLLMFKTDSLLSVLDRLLMILICSVLLWGGITHETFRIEWFVYAQTLAYLLTAIIALIVVIRKASFRKLSWNRPFFILIVRQSFPFAILVLLMTFYNRLDSVMLERILPGVNGERQSGIYASAYRLLDATNMIAYLFSVLLLPIFSKMLKLKERIEQMLKLSFTLLITLAVIVATGSFFYSFDIMQLLYREHVNESSRVFALLMFGFIPISTTYVFGTLLTANGNLKALNIMAASGMVLNFTLNIILIPRFEAVGSAWASLCTQGFTALIQVLMVHRLFHLKVQFRFLLTLATFIAGVVLINYISHGLHISWYYSFFMMLVASSLLAFSLKLIHLRSLFSIIRHG
jgi:O-antigen/teichoic acid export membrane protein